MPTFIKLDKEDRNKLFYQARNNLNTSFNKMYSRFRISRAMFFNYLAGRYDIPKTLFLELEKISGIKIINYAEINKNKYIQKEIKEPLISLSLAEIIGALNGDGHISSINHEICIVGNALESEYKDYLKNLLEKTFNLKFTILEDDSSFKIRTYCKQLADLLNIKYGLPKGNKMGQLKIPTQILNSKNLLTSYLRGLFDTDGSFFIRRKKDPVIEIISADPRYLKQVQEALIQLGFNARISDKHVYIYDKGDIKRFFLTISPANTKHLKKYQGYLKSTERE